MNTNAFNCSAYDRRGAMLPLVAVVIVILFVAASLAIDIARIHVTRSELRTATDAAARAAVEALGREQSTDAALQAALSIALENSVAGKGLELEAADIEFGGAVQQSDGTFSFDPNSKFTNSVRVVGKRTEDSPGGPVNLMFGPLFGVTDFQPIQSATATRLDRDIALVLDVSGSMRQNRRFEGLANALNIFLNELDKSPQEENVSLTVYSTTDRKRVNLTNNFSAIRTAFAQESPRGFTAIGRGISTGLNSVLNDPRSRKFALKSIIVMTDGNHNRGINPATVARTVAGKDVTLHTITFSNGANQALMQQCAQIGKGQHIHAQDNAQLAQAFRTIARQLRVLLTE